jgi:tetratricopeptide (TPR) repeat protein
MSLSHFRISLMAILWFTCLLAPAQAQSIDRARQLYQNRQIEQAVSEVDAVIAASPGNMTAYSDKGIYLRQLGIRDRNRARLREAVGLFTMVLSSEKDPQQRVILQGNLATTYIELGEFAKASEGFRSCAESSGRIFYRVRSAYCLARQGQTAAAVRTVSNVRPADLRGADSPGNYGLTAYNIAVVHALAGNAPEAVRWLRISSSARHWSTSWLRKDSDLARIKDSGPFKEFLRSISAG